MWNKALTWMTDYSLSSDDTEALKSILFVKDMEAIYLQEVLFLGRVSPNSLYAEKPICLGNEYFSPIQSPDNMILQMH